MKNTPRIAVLLLSMCISGFAHSADWNPIATTAAGDVFFIDREGMTVKGKIRKAWFQALYKESKTLPTGKSDNVRLQNYFNCEDRSMANAQSIYYASDDPSKVVFGETTEVKDLLYTDVVPDSIGEIMLNAVCRPGKR